MRGVSERWKTHHPPFRWPPSSQKHFLFLPPHFLPAAKTKSVRILFGRVRNRRDRLRPFAGWRDGCRVRARRVTGFCEAKQPAAQLLGGKIIAANAATTKGRQRVEPREPLPARPTR